MATPTPTLPPCRRLTAPLLLLAALSLLAASDPAAARRSHAGDELNLLFEGDFEEVKEHKMHRAAPALFTKTPEDTIPNREKRSFSSDDTYSYVKSAKGRDYGGGVKDTKVTQGYDRGCASPPQNPPHTIMNCVIHSGCRLNCLQGYEFPHGDTKVFLICQNSKWQIAGAEWDEIPDCRPICLPPCENNGICVKPDTCNCTGGFRGPQCQYSSKPCFNDLPLPAYSVRRCTSKTCTVECLKGYRFPDGTAIANLKCHDGTWVPTRKDLTSVPDCQAICTPPCQNGGNCLAYNTCQCPQNFKGLQCQYAKENCSPQKLDFNGQYACHGDRHSLTCRLTCPSGVFESPPVESYVCEYAIGKYLPSPIPKCNYDAFNVSYNIPTRSNSNYTNEISTGVTLGVLKPRTPGTCYCWADHYKTFDGRILSFRSNCSYTLAQEVADNTFSIVLGPKVNAVRNVEVFAQDRDYVLSRNEEGLPILQLGKRRFHIPTQLPGVNVKYSAHFVELTFTLAGFSVLWDTESIVSVNVNEYLWNRTAGLCGRMDGYSENDLEMKDGTTATRILPFANSWQVERLGEICNSYPEESHPCNSLNSELGPPKEAQVFCDRLLSDPRFAACRSLVDVRPYYDACLWDYCSCQAGSRCACQSIAMFVWQCNARGTPVAQWRDATLCPMECEGGRVYMACNPENQPTCGSQVELEGPSPILGKRENGRTCIEGCYCPSGTVLHEQRCILREKCPCQLRGRVFPPATVIPKDCNTCTCENGTWICTEARCSARCSCIGDPHYTTFDGRQYDFMGKCSYYLVKADTYSIEAQNIACSGAFSKNGGNVKGPSCARTITINLNGKRIQLKQGHEVVVDGVEIPRLPLQVAGAYIHEASSVYVLVVMPNNMTIWWDGVTSLYIDAPPSIHGETKGLCGTFNMNQRDDFVTPEEDVEQSVIAFANKWKTEEVCENEPEKEPVQPCDLNPHKRASAEKYCNHLKGSLFERCHWLVDPEPYYHDCMYDMCSCEQKIGQCLCPIIAAYAKECARKDKKLQILWRSTIRECGMACPSGQEYQVCGNTCTRSCQSISQSKHCMMQCVEGCNCPSGETLNDDTGECIPISKCPCQFEGLDFLPGFKDIRPARDGHLLCTCENALWNCRPATPKEVKDNPPLFERSRKCSETKNETFTTCKSPEPVSCKNMHKPPHVSPAVCQMGCTCKKGFVMDHDSKRCIRAAECPCHHGGQSYSEGSSIQEECNTCTCKSGKWKCTEYICSGMCTAWGDSHYKTFDSRIFDFHGTCDYVLAKGYLSRDESFDVTIQNVQCSSLGISCSKSVTLRVAHGGQHERVVFVKDKTLPSVTGFQRIQVRTAGLFVFAEVTDLGLVLQWDQGNQVYVKIDPKWKNKVRGLCGNYNDNMLDDFQTPSGGPAEVSSTLFGDSWRLQSYCPESVEITNACAQHPNRKLWAMQKCGILKSSLFQHCHSEVPVEPYLERCIFDTCACDLGGDCECLCTALATYAHECNMRGVHIRWRSQKLCPMQCDEKCSGYSPCIKTCPHTTCDNQYIIKSLTHLCKEDTCVEGCEVKPCPPGQVHYNATSLDCVPVASCKTVCSEVDGKVFYENDVMEVDACHTCTCSHHKKTCIGVPCTTVPTTTTTTTTTTREPDTEPECKPGWSQWINKNKIHGKKVSGEYEPLPELNMFSDSPVHCSKSEIKDIECRTVGSNLSHKEWATINYMNVICDIDNGFVCKGAKCKDFEIRVLCSCGPKHSTSSPKPEVTSASTTTTYGTPETETPENTSPVTEISTTTTVRVDVTVSAKPCETGDIWKDCGVPCDQVCLYYGYVLQTRGYCRSSEDCFSGCVADELTGGCPRGFVWRDHRTCVAKADCLCYSHKSEPVKPGDIKYESDCEICQCINNMYVCDTTACRTTRPPPSSDSLIFNTTTAITTSTAVPTPTMTVPSSVTPPLPCQDEFIPLVEGIEPLPDTAFSASSTGPGIRQQPHYARISGRDSEYAWMPQSENDDQYLQVKLKKIEPIYGVTVQGAAAGYVTSYQVLYSTDGLFYHYVMDENVSPAVFRGPASDRSSQSVMFFTPVEARYVRFHPKTWRNAIAMRVEIYGCGELPTTLTPTLTMPTFPPEVCTDEMGLNNGMMSDQQVMVSSVRGGDLRRYGSSEVRLSASADEATGRGGAWVPATDDKDQWLQFDFLEPRNITGFITKGLEKSNAWVEIFKVQYSHDGDIWNNMLANDGNEKTFLANFDDKTPHKNKFGHTLRTRFLRLIPAQWHRNIAVRAEVIGCFELYPTITSPAPSPRPDECLPCPGVPTEQIDEVACRNCPVSLSWDGESCVNGSHCPCFFGHIRYEVGKVYSTEDCHECICKIGGNSNCKRKECYITCEPGYYSTLTPGCGCICKRCPEGTVLCPSSNICIDKSLWCNGVEDCPDDERNCTTVTPTTTHRPLTTTCPVVTCAPGTKPVRQSSRYIEGHVKGKGNSKVKGFGGFPTRLHEAPGVCDEIICVEIGTTTPRPPEKCPKRRCPPTHMLVTTPGKTKDPCPPQLCVPKHSTCNITERTADTFDGLELKHGICNHILVRDAINNKWDVSLLTNCSAENHCSRHLNIIQDRYIVNLYSDMSLDINGVRYSSHETKHLGGTYRPYAVYHVGDSLLFQSNHYGFWVVWDTKGVAKIGVTGKLYGEVEGLCGTFNENLLDDRTTPYGNIVKTNAEFVKSWAIPGLPNCEDTTCPHDLFIHSQEICNSVRDEPLNQCGSVIDLNRFIDRCVESVCACLSKIEGSATNCRCQALLDLVTQCQATDASIDLSGWRTYHGCPARCPPPLVHQDCYRHKCEPRCGAMQELESCDALSGTCFSGCFCPDGYLRHNDQCLSPNECRDCVCNGFGDPQYLTFDRSNFTFNGNCTYIASRDKSLSGNHTYQVLVTNKQCPDEPASRCTAAIEVQYENHSVSVKHSFGLQHAQLEAFVDEKPVTQFPHKEGSWLRLERVDSSEITVLVLPIQLEVTYYLHNYGFTIRLPSQIFRNKMEGLCGNCNKHKLDDFEIRNGTITNDINQFAMSWLHPRPSETECGVPPIPPDNCTILPPNEDPCLKLIDSTVFQKCRNVLDVAPYVAACQSDQCHSLNNTDTLCRYMEAYVANCLDLGICLEWRSAELCPFTCPPDREFRSCQSGCAKTCENLHEDASKCTSVVLDGCYCPEGQVLERDTCVDASRCLTCDEKGHFAGDIWQEEVCTNCTCEGTTKKCVKMMCPDVTTVCEEGMEPLEVPPLQNECCSKIICVRTSMTTSQPCPPPKVPKCNDDQYTTSITDADGCNSIVCKCKPCPEAELTNEDTGSDDEVVLKPGFRFKVDNSSCCNKFIKQCYPEYCPKPRDCSSPLVLEEIRADGKNTCCSDYKCIKPPNSCIIEDGNGVVVKKVGSKWRESPCRSCECRDISDTAELYCTNTVCPSGDMNINVTLDYVVETNIRPEECCPWIHISACKVNDFVLQIGETKVERHLDHCTTYMCERTSTGDVLKKTEIERCSIDCNEGWEYVKPEENSDACCGQCQPIGCIHDDVLHQQGTTWKSEDNCVDYFCLSVNGTFQIDVVKINCPKLPKEMYEDYLIEEYNVPGECCNAPIYIACNFSGRIVKEEEELPAPAEPCKKLRCVRKPDGQLVQRETLEMCSTNCSLGWEYIPAAPGSDICCGRCEQVACSFDDKIYAANSTWKSPDECTEYICQLSSSGQYQVNWKQETCPALDNCPPENIYREKCCEKCKISPPAKCGAVMKSLNHTKHLISERLSSHGVCVNNPLDNFSECEGECFSRTVYNQESNTHVKVCKCCLPKEFIDVDVSMTCEDYHTYTKTIAMPSVCSCENCETFPEQRIEEPVEVTLGAL